MADARSLRDLFDDLVSRPSGASGERPADPSEELAAAGHGGLPGELVAQAVASYAETAPLPVAQALSDFTSAYSDGGIDPGEAVAGLDVLAGYIPPGDEAVLLDPWAMDAGDLPADSPTDTTEHLDGLWAGGPADLSEQGDDAELADATIAGAGAGMGVGEAAYADPEPGFGVDLDDDLFAVDGLRGEDAFPAETGIDDADFGSDVLDVAALLDGAGSAVDPGDGLDG